MPIVPLLYDIGRNESPAHSHPVMWQCVDATPLPTAPKQCGNTLKGSYCPLLPSNVALSRKSSTAHQPPAL